MWRGCQCHCQQPILKCLWTNSMECQRKPSWRLITYRTAEHRPTCLFCYWVISSATFDTLTVQTPIVGDDAVDQQLKIVLQFEHQLYIDTGHYFTFYGNRTIDITDVQPRHHLTTYVLRFLFFTAQCTMCIARYWDRMLSVCPSVWVWRSGIVIT